MEIDIETTEPSPPPSMFEQFPIPGFRPPEPSVSEYELESRRKSSPPVLARRKTLTTYVASLVGVAWFVCLFAVGQSALRSMIVTIAHH